MAAVVMVVKMSIIKALLKTAASAEQKVKPKEKKENCELGEINVLKSTVASCVHRKVLALHTKRNLLKFWFVKLSLFLCFLI